MDDRRFDDAVRFFARHRSRRALVGCLVGGGAALLTAHLRSPGAAARQGYSAQGEPCFDDAQCLAADTPLVCAWNGYGSAGAACCAPSGGRCGDPAGCCGPSTCYLGTCWDLTSPAAGESCWQLPGDPDPCADGLVCIHDSETGGAWGTCQPLATDTGGATGEWCGGSYCESWQRCCSQCSGICAPSDAVCGEGFCRSGWACPPECSAAGPCSPGCQSGYCNGDGTCA
jgi:hypothetical protein